MKIIRILILVNLMLFFCQSTIFAFDNTDKYNDIIFKTFQLYSLMYEDNKCTPYISDGAAVVSVKYKESKAYGYFLEEDYETPEKFINNLAGFMGKPVAKAVFKETTYFGIVNGKIVLYMLGPQDIMWEWIAEAETSCLKNDNDEIILEREFLHKTLDIDAKNETVKFTFIFKKENGEYKLSGGSFLEKMLNVNISNPQTSDSPVIAICALAVSAAAAIVFIKKKKAV
ncbi:MAG: hypothetical protein IKH51_07530 [Clostridia bacterium]|nr:hypothetical protein [Clostridia bacterium]